MDSFQVRAELKVRVRDPPAAYYRHGGILLYVLRRLLLGRERLGPLPRPAGAARPGPRRIPAPVDVEAGFGSFPASDPPSHLPRTQGLGQWVASSANGAHEAGI